MTITRHTFCAAVLWDAPTLCAEFLYKIAQAQHEHLLYGVQQWTERGERIQLWFWKRKDGRQEGEHSVRGRRNTTITVNSRAAHGHLHWERVAQISEEHTRSGLNAQACTLP